MTAPRPRVEGEAELTLEWIQDMAACKYTPRNDRVNMMDPTRGLFLNQRTALARRVLALTAEVERLREIAHRAIDILDGMERRTMDIDPETGEFDDAVDVLRTALDRAALSLPTPAPEATE